MKVDKISVSFAPELGDLVRGSAKRAGRGISGWLADAAAEKLRREAFDELMTDWEIENGALTESELEAARVRLGFSNTAAS